VQRRSRVRVRFTDAGEVEEFWMGGSDATAADDARGWRCMMLAPTIEICQALIRGERVPRELLNQDWLGRFSSSS
jgi:hypothetical protein